MRQSSVLYDMASALESRAPWLAVSAGSRFCRAPPFCPPGRQHYRTTVAVAARHCCPVAYLTLPRAQSHLGAADYLCRPPDARDGLLSLPAPDLGSAVRRTTTVLADRGHSSDPLPTSLDAFDWGCVIRLLQYSPDNPQCPHNNLIR